LLPVMRQESRSTDIAMAAPMPVALRRSRSDATRRMTAIAFLRITFGLIWSVPGATTDVGAAIIYSFVFWALLLVDAGRVSVDRLIAAKIPAWPHFRIVQPYSQPRCRHLFMLVARLGSEEDLIRRSRRKTAIWMFGEDFSTGQLTYMPVGAATSHGPPECPATSPTSLSEMEFAVSIMVRAAAGGRRARK